MLFLKNGCPLLRTGQTVCVQMDLLMCLLDAFLRLRRSNGCLRGGRNAYTDTGQKRCMKGKIKSISRFNTTSQQFGAISLLQIPKLSINPQRSHIIMQIRRGDA